ncbi:hypothetical protein UFOVP244_12 [uncultured Caudovirales phage]|uniref:Uncharacterized protein n=1 Tax=uncultured Caudovirales phage TaxID=2100421 RepID=A0A6J7WRH1_9CAUD|nr:hypothetical protein UFOVP244_12 [uncultured Caudovirales phage]
MFKTEQEALQALRNTISELDDLTKSWSKDAEKDLKKWEVDPAGAASIGNAFGKSGDLKKWEVDPAGAASIGHAFGKSDEDEAAPEEASAEAAPTAEQAAPEASVEPAGAEEAPEAAPEQGDDQGEEGDVFEQIVSEAANLSDEELDMLLHALMSEKDQRGDAQAPADETAPESEPEASVEPEEKPLAMSVKSELSKMAKSFEAQISVLTKSVDSLRHENDKMRKQIAKPSTRPAPSNSVEVLQKSAPVAEPLTKHEKETYLLGELRKGNKLVRAEHVALIGACRTDADFAAAAEILRNQGVEIPNKK